MVESHPDEHLYNLNCKPWYDHSKCNGVVYSVGQECAVACFCRCHRPEEDEVVVASKPSKTGCAE
jgi:hypothetical protein